MQDLLLLNQISFFFPFFFPVIPKNTMLKSPKQEEEAFEIVKVKIPMDIKQESDGEATN